MINGAIKRALQVAKMRNGQTQSATIPPRPQAPVPRQKDMPVDPTRSKSSQERNKFKDGGEVMKHDKLNHALDIALSASHPKRLHHTLARTGYAEGGIPDIEGPADLAKEVPFTHDKMMASQFDVAKAQPYKAPKIALGPVKVAQPKKVVVRGPRSDIGKLRAKKPKMVKFKGLKFSKGGAAIEDALNLAKRLMKDAPDHGAAFQQGATSTVVKEKLPGKKSEVLYEHHERTPPQGAVFKRGGRGNG